eukprot:3168221-Amphidinium_carterae.2
MLLANVVVAVVVDVVVVVVVVVVGVVVHVVAISMSHAIRGLARAWPWRAGDIALRLRLLWHKQECPACELKHLLPCLNGQRKCKYNSTVSC